MSKFETKPLSKVATTAEEIAEMQKAATKIQGFKEHLDSGFQAYDGLKTSFKGFATQLWESTSDEGKTNTGGYYVAVFNNGSTIPLHLFNRGLQIVDANKKTLDVPHLEGGISDVIASNSNMNEENSLPNIKAAFDKIKDGEFVVKWYFDYAVANGQRPKKFPLVNFMTSKEAKELRKKLAED
jgi:hypothetical protein